MTTSHRAEPVSLGRLVPIVLGSSIAVLAVAVANSAARNENVWWTGPLFWVALVAILLPTAFRLLTPAVSRGERLWLVAWLVAALYLVKVLYEPNQFALHDELGQLRTTNDLSDTGHLFSPNPIVRAYPYYPGLNAATAALVKLTHLSTFTAGTVLIGAARLAGGLGLYLLLVRLTKSQRLAAIGLFVYVANPNFLYFDAQYAYESLALQLAFVVLLAVDVARTEEPADRAGICVFGAVLLGAVVVTHHLTSYWLVVVLLGAGLIGAARVRQRAGAATSVTLGIVAVAMVLVWQLLVVRGAVAPELEPILNGARGLVTYLTGDAGGGKKLFQSSTGQGGESLWAQVVGFASVGMALVLLPVGLWRMLRRRRWRRPQAVLMALTAVLLPLTLALRLTQAGTETSNRASEYLYVGVGLLAGAAATYLPGFPDFRRKDPDRPPAPTPTPWARVATIVAAAYVIVMFVGGFVVGWPPYARQPGPYLAAADIRSVGPEGMAAARWADEHIPAGTYIAADEINGLLMSAYARLNPQTGTYAGTPVSTLFYASRIGATERTVIAGDKIAYIVVDRRLSTFPPYAKGYFNGSTPTGVNPSLPLPEEALAKFGSTAGFHAVYDSGPIAIYATGLR